MNPPKISSYVYNRHVRLQTHKGHFDAPSNGEVMNFIGTEHGGGHTGVERTHGP
jgi:hypothetical protein